MGVVVVVWQGTFEINLHCVNGYGCGQAIRHLCSEMLWAIVSGDI